jgi:Holliday junction resolvasome RuvABC endonuclease subunit
LVRRARYLDRALLRVFATDRWSISAVCAETMSWPRNAATSARIGIGWGILIGRVGDRPMAQASPQEVKLAMGLARSASKEEVQQAVRERFGRYAFDAAEIHPALFEHAYDAAAVVVACLENETIRMLRGRAA